MLFMTLTERGGGEDRVEEAVFFFRNRIEIITKSGRRCARKGGRERSDQLNHEICIKEEGPAS